MIEGAAEGLGIDDQRRFSTPYHWPMAVGLGAGFYKLLYPIREHLLRGISLGYVYYLNCLDYPNFERNSSCRDIKRDRSLFHCVSSLYSQRRTADFQTGGSLHDSGNLHAGDRDLRPSDDLQKSGGE